MLTPHQQAVFDVIESSGRPLGPKEIAEAPSVESPYQSVQQILSDLVEQGVLVKPRRGYYAVLAPPDTAGDVMSPPEATPREATLREPLAMEGADPDDWEGEAPEAPLPSGVLFEIRGPQGVIYRLTIQAEQVGEPLRTYARAAETA